MNNLISFIGSIVSFFYPPSLKGRFNNLRILAYTSYWRRFFKSFGTNSRISLRVWYVCGLKHIEVGDNVSIGGGVQLTAWERHGDNQYDPSIIIGDGTSLGSQNHITAINSIVIGKNVLTGKGVLITDNSHGSISLDELKQPPSTRKLRSKGAVVIGDRVWLGDKVSVLPGVHIGEGSVIGANSVVTCDIPAYCVAVGVPARVVKVLSEKQNE